MPATLTPAEKIEMNDKAVSAIILCFGDKVLREVTRETFVVAMWTKLDSLYMIKSLAHRQCQDVHITFVQERNNLRH
jgi:hypothetical protein